MKSYAPRPGDVAMDLQRCFEASLYSESFRDKTFNIFFKHAINDLKLTENRLNKTTLRNVKKCLKRVMNKNLEIKKRREDLLTASGLLLYS